MVPGGGAPNPGHPQVFRGVRVVRRMSLARVDAVLREASTQKTSVVEAAAILSLSGRADRKARCEDMRKDVIDRTQASIWRQLADAVEVFAPGADVDADDPVWTGLAVRTVPDPTDAPGGGTLSYQTPIRGFSFRLAGAPVLKQHTKIRHAAKVWTVDEIAESGSDQIRVTVFT